VKWRYFADREFPRVVRELGLPCAESVRVTGMNRCPRHRRPLGGTRICLDCHNEAWEEVARRYRTAQPTREEKHVQHEPQPTGMTAELVPIEGELVPEEPSTDLALRPQALFGTDPELALKRQVELSKLVVGPVEQQHLFVNIRGRKYVKVEGWELVGAMKSVFASIVWTRPNEANDGYVARAEARWLDDRFADGRLVGAGEAECSRQEEKWKDREPYAIRAMAQTRAISRALRGPLGPVFVLADYEMVGAEEMPVVDVRPVAKQETPEAIPDEAKPTEGEKNEIARLVSELDRAAPDTDWRAWCREQVGVPWKLLTRGGAGLLIDRLQTKLAAFNDDTPEAA
jgi:hypothetical protein